MLYRPVRERSLPLLEKLVEEGLNATGFDELSFLSLSAGDFSALEGLFDAAAARCAARQVALALPSLRVGSVNDSIMARIAGIRRTGATLAPEAGSRRLRDVINKGVTEEDLIAHAQKLLRHGWRQVKLYFMIGLPAETREDLDAILDLGLKVRDAAGRGGPRLSVTVSLSPFVPKAHTPFQWEAQTPLEQIKERTEYLISLFRGRKGLRLRWHKAEMSCLEGVLSRGDRRLAPVLERAYAKGAVFSSWTEGFSLDPWIEALRECGWSIEDWTGPRTPGDPLPWDHLESGIDPAFLLREREKAFAGTPSRDCRYGACLRCGVCRTEKSASRLARPGLDGDIRTRLNFPQRDQESGAAERDGAEAPYPSRISAGKSRPPHPAAELGVKAAQYRIWHRKENDAAFLSQLELQSILERAMRRADLPLTFSRGFHPLPLLSFGRALPVGVSSLAEWFAVTLREALSPSETARRLGPRLPRGMELVRVETVHAKNRTVQAQREIFRIDCAGDARERERFLEYWRAFEKTERFLLKRATGKGEREVDLRALVEEVTYPEEGGVRCVMDWRAGYLSPLAMARAVSREENAARLVVVKLEQIFHQESE
jgi:radical SAM-linked protein